MPESLLVRRILQEYRKRGAWAEKMHGNDFVRAGLPDIIACYKGFFIAIECKMPGNYPTDMQTFCRKEIHQSHGISLVAYTLEDALTTLDSIDNSAFYGSYACLVCGSYMLYDEEHKSIYCTKGHMSRSGNDTSITEETSDAIRLRSKDAGRSKKNPAKVSAITRGRLLTFPTKGAS